MDNDNFVLNTNQCSFYKRKFLLYFLLSNCTILGIKLKVRAVATRESDRRKTTFVALDNFENCLGMRNLSNMIEREIFKDLSNKKYVLLLLTYIAVNCKLLSTVRDANSLIFAV
jgi:hypothetical protein